MLNRLRTLVTRSGAYMLGSALQRGVSVLLIPLYAFYLRPEGFAILGLAEVVASLGRIAFSMGLEGAAFRFYFVYTEGEERRRFYGSVWMFQLAVSLLVAVILTSRGSQWIAPLLEQVPFAPHLQLAVWIAFFRAGFEVMALQIFRAQGEAGRFAALSLINFILAVALQVYFVAVRGAGALGALQGMLLTAALMAGFYGWVMVGQSSWRVSWAYISRALGYGLPLLPHFLAHWILSLSDRWILERNVPLAQVGVYSLGDQIRQGYTVIPWSANSAFMPTFGRASQDSQERANIPRLTTYYLFGICAVGLAVVLFMPLVLPWIAPPAFAEAAIVVPWLILGSVLYGAYFIPMNVISQTLGRTRSVSVITLTAAALNIGLNLLLVPRWGILAAAINTAIGYGLLFGLMQWWAQRQLHIEYEWDRAVKVLSVAVLLALMAYFLPPGTGTVTQWLSRLALLIAYPGLLAILGFVTERERTELKRMFAELTAG